MEELTLEIIKYTSIIMRGEKVEKSRLSRSRFVDSIAGN